MNNMKELIKIDKVVKCDDGYELFYTPLPSPIILDKLHYGDTYTEDKYNGHNILIKNIEKDHILVRSTELEILPGMILMEKPKLDMDDVLSQEKENKSVGLISGLMLHHTVIHKDEKFSVFYNNDGDAVLKKFGINKRNNELITIPKEELFNFALSLLNIHNDNEKSFKNN